MPQAITTFFNRNKLGNQTSAYASKILVVDDEPDNLDLLYRTFHREFKVLRSESGPKALEILEREGDIAVIVSDQRMPQMSGTEFLSLTAAGPVNPTAQEKVLEPCA